MKNYENGLVRPVLFIETPLFEEDLNEALKADIRTEKDRKNSDNLSLEFEFDDDGRDRYFIGDEEVPRNEAYNALSDFYGHRVYNVAPYTEIVDGAGSTHTNVIVVFEPF